MLRSDTIFLLSGVETALVEKNGRGIDVSSSSEGEMS
jgi:hypothetical protein